MYDQFRYFREDAFAFYCSEEVARPVPAYVLAATVAGAVAKPNEDRFGARGNDEVLEFLLLDGATSLLPIPELQHRGMTGAEFAAQEVLNLWHQQPLGISGTDLLIELNRQFRQLLTTLPSLDLNDPRYVPSATAILAQITSERISITSAGDSFVLARPRQGAPFLVTPHTTSQHEEEILLLMQTLARQHQETPREASRRPEIRAALEQERLILHNKPGGTAVLNGSPEFAAGLFQAEFQTAEMKSLLIGSDGIVPPGLSRNRADEIFNKLEELGLAGLIEYKKNLEDRDPDWNLLRFKHSDDATGIWVKF